MKQLNLMEHSLLGCQERYRCSGNVFLGRFLNKLTHKKLTQKLTCRFVCFVVAFGGFLICQNTRGKVPPGFSPNTSLNDFHQAEIEVLGYEKIAKCQKNLKRPSPRLSLLEDTRWPFPCIENLLHHSPQVQNAHLSDS